MRKFIIRFPFVLVGVFVSNLSFVFASGLPFGFEKEVIENASRAGEKLKKSLRYVAAYLKAPAPCETTESTEASSKKSPEAA